MGDSQNGLHMWRCVGVCGHATCLLCSCEGSRIPFDRRHRHHFTHQKSVAKTLVPWVTHVKAMVRNVAIGATLHGAHERIGCVP